MCCFQRGDSVDKQAEEETNKPAEVTTKRSREDMEVDVEAENTGSPARDNKPETIKTAAQAERLRRKKQLQKAKKRKVD